MAAREHHVARAAARPVPAPAFAAALSVVGMSVLLLTTRWGIGTSVDSVAYIRAARAMASGSGETLRVQHAPLYSFLLAAGGTLGLDPMDGARWLNTLTFGVNICLVGVLIRHTTANVPWLWAIGSTLMLVLAPMLMIHATALSEPLFLTAVLAGFWMLARYAEQPTRGKLLISAILMGLALLARYAGAAGVLAGALAILVMGPKPGRLRDTQLFGVVACAPMLAWVMRNWLVASSATGRDLAFHPVGLSHAWQALYTVSGWLLIPQSAPDVLRFVAVSAVAGLVLAAVVRASRESAPIPVLVRILALFVAIYGAFLATSISFLDANTPLDDRILLPVLAVSIVLASYVIDTLWPVARPMPILASALAAVMALFIGGHGLKAAEVGATGYRDGSGFSSAAWRQSQALSHVARLQPDVPVFSNAPEIVYLHTGRPARGIPRTLFLMNQEPNRDFASQLAAVGQEVREQCGVVVYLRNLAQRSMPSEAEVSQGLSLDVLSDAGDGVILGVTACRP